MEIFGLQTGLLKKLVEFRRSRKICRKLKKDLIGTPLGDLIGTPLGDLIGTPLEDLIVITHVFFFIEDGYKERLVINFRPFCEVVFLLN